MYALLELYGKFGDTIIDALESDELYELDSFESDSNESLDSDDEVVELVGDNFFGDFLSPGGNNPFSRTAAIYYSILFYYIICIMPYINELFY
jgi:hypothetical protein